MKKLIAVSAVLVLSLFFAACSDTPDSAVNPTSFQKNPSFTAEYQITVENLTPAGSQVFSPPVFAAHSPSYRMFHVGEYASTEIAQLAQDGLTAPLVMLLNSSGEVFDVVVGTGPIMPGASEMYTINVEGNYSKLSFATMLVNTNDGFTGVDKLQLPQKGTKVYYLTAYDAGSEQNTELDDHIPGPCCGNPLMGIPSNEKIMPHAGILGIGDLDPLVYGWDEPVAKLTITRVN